MSPSSSGSTSLPQKQKMAWSSSSDDPDREYWGEARYMADRERRSGREVGARRRKRRRPGGEGEVL